MSAKPTVTVAAVEARVEQIDAELEKLGAELDMRRAERVRFEKPEGLTSDEFDKLWALDTELDEIDERIRTLQADRLPLATRLALVELERDKIERREREHRNRAATVATCEVLIRAVEALDAFEALVAEAHELGVVDGIRVERVPETLRQIQQKAVRARGVLVPHWRLLLESATTA